MLQDIKIHSSPISKPLLYLNAIVALLYISWWFLPSHIDNPYLYMLLFAGEIYHVLMALTFWYTLYPKAEVASQNLIDSKRQPSVDVFITVAGEHVEIVRQTVMAAKDMEYGNHKSFYF